MTIPNRILILGGCLLIGAAPLLTAVGWRELIVGAVPIAISLLTLAGSGVSTFRRSRDLNLAVMSGALGAAAGAIHGQEAGALLCGLGWGMLGLALGQAIRRRRPGARWRSWVADASPTAPDARR